MCLHLKKNIWLQFIQQCAVFFHLSCILAELFLPGELRCVNKSHLLYVCLAAVCSSKCSLLECWFVQERPGGGGFSVGMSQEKSALYIRTSPDSEKTHQKPPSDISPSRVYYVSGQYDVYFDI